MRTRLICVLFFIVTSVHAFGAGTAPNVVVSIKPIHSLVAGVMGEAGTPRLMVPGTASPHMYQMRPSEAKALRDADLVVWIGNTMETFLERPIANLGADAEVVTLHKTARMRLLPNREGGIWSGEEEAGFHEDEHEHDHRSHGHREFDMHLWLDPDNTRRIVEVVADALIRRDPDRAETYRSNAEAMHERIVAQATALRERLAPVRERAFIVFHDGYRYFEHAFGLEGIGAVAIDPARLPGAKRIAELREALTLHDVRCMFTEAQFEPDLVRTVIEGSGVRTAALDPLGVDAEPGPDAWFEIMRGLGDAFAECLGAG